jgi:hypothetical protein
MRFLRSVFFALAALLWLPLSAHCQLETVPGFEFLQCIDAQTPGDTDCNDSSCCAFEKSQYQSSQVRVTIPPPDLLPLLPVALIETRTTVSDEVSAAAFADAPPVLPKGWQFVFRVASPPRAPSFAS